MAKIAIQNNYALKTTDVFICRWPIFFQSSFFLYSKTQTLSLATSKRSSKLQRIAIFCKERKKKSLTLNSRSEAQWLTWFWWKLWAWMTSLKKEHGIREKAICFKTVIWSGCFSGCSAPVPGQDSFLSPRMLLFLVSFECIPWYVGLTSIWLLSWLVPGNGQAIWKQLEKEHYFSARFLTAPGRCYFRATRSSMSLAQFPLALKHPVKAR